ncbi:MAG: hypothetical protein PVG19_02060 [Desulfobacterales bacterium]|jgi:hypothetical protein
MRDPIDELKALDDRYPWCSDFDDIEIIVISAEGLYENYSEHADPIVGPYVLSDEDYNSLINVSDESELEDMDFDPEEAPEMFTAGCEPGVSYFKWGESLPGDDDFHEWDEIFSAYADMLIKNSDPTPWEEVAEDYAQELYEAVNHARQGYTGWHEVPEEERPLSS